MFACVRACVCTRVFIQGCTERQLNMWFTNKRRRSAKLNTETVHLDRKVNQYGTNHENGGLSSHGSATPGHSFGPPAINAFEPADVEYMVTLIKTGPLRVMPCPQIGPKMRGQNHTTRNVCRPCAELQRRHILLCLLNFHCRHQVSQSPILWLTIFTDLII